MRGALAPARSETKLVAPAWDAGARLTSPQGENAARTRRTAPRMSLFHFDFFTLLDARAHLARRARAGAFMVAGAGGRA
jgi:hypothetical protein